MPGILRRCGVQPKYASLLWICAPGPAKRGRAFYKAISLATFYEIITFDTSQRLGAMLWR
ncbi:MAG: hypothetical protein NTY64_05680 [Deltaproteobacteria bacterium]|nr:hypothetical protein [Deltaproteobacteria bacterium]